MATPLTAARAHDLLRGRLGASRLVTYDGWETHNRGKRGDGWGPVHGVMVHHFGPYTSESGAVEYARRGGSDLPGPLYPIVITRDGRVHLVGWGRANHAGTGDGRVLDHLIREDLPFPAPRYSQGQSGGIDMNARTYGVCLVNKGDGKQAFPVKQLHAAHVVCAALIEGHSSGQWTHQSCIGHKESQRGKPDPRFSMNTFRYAVRDILRGSDHGEC